MEARGKMIKERLIKIKYNLYQDILRRLKKNAEIHKLESGPFFLIASELKETKEGKWYLRKMHQIAKVIKMLYRKDIDFSYFLHKEITMLKIEKVGENEYAFDSGLYINIEQVINEDIIIFKDTYQDANDNSSSKNKGKNEFLKRAVGKPSFA